MVKVAILCGGVGSRLWPLSRKEKPKQFIKLPGTQYNLFQQTVIRINQLVFPCSETIIVSNIEIKDDIIDCFAPLTISCPITFLWEPLIKNTGPAIGLLIAYLHNCTSSSYSDDQTCLIWPSDHLLDMEAFNHSLVIAQKYLNHGIVTFGVCPTYPETGYGYITASEEGKIVQFIEKPHITVAEQLLKTPLCYWNSGMFYFNIAILWQEYQHLASDLLAQMHEGLHSSLKINNHVYPHKDAYTHYPDIPFDKLIMEKTNKGYLVALNGTWSDIGSWDAVAKLQQPTSLSNGNEIIQIDTRNCHVYNYHEKQIVSLIGLKDLCIVNTPDALLIADLSQTQKVKHIYQQLDQLHSKSIQNHIKNQYSWGTIEKLDDHINCYQVYKYVINQGKETMFKEHQAKYVSLITVCGHGHVIIGETLHEMNVLNQPVNVPNATKYRIFNGSDQDKFILLMMMII